MCFCFRKAVIRTVKKLQKYVYGYAFDTKFYTNRSSTASKLISFQQAARKLPKTFGKTKKCTVNFS